MSAKSLDRLLSELEAARYRFGAVESGRILKLLRRLDAVARFPTPASLIRFHESLLFLRAFPQSPAVQRKTERILSGFHKRVEEVRKADADMDAFDTFEFAGIAGTTMEDMLGFEVARWLVRRMPGKVEIAWDNYEPGRELSNTGPRFMPLLEDDACVEADTPWPRWLQAAAGKKRPTVAWLIERCERLSSPEHRSSDRRSSDSQKSAQLRAELYDSLRVPLRWELGNSPITRTRNRQPVRKVFYHDGPLISRSQVSLADELAKRPPSFTRLTLPEGERIADMIREIMLVRYRELYGTTLPDPRSVVRADLGRGVSIYLWNLPAERRLPLRAYTAGFTSKNGVPINYIEAIGLCEWMEVGFNTFYTFRGGEAGWIYAQVLRCLCHLMGTTCISVYPYQLGHDNDEAIESGAFWFYRKLGFRPGRADLRELVAREEKKIAADPRYGVGVPARAYRTPARTLKRLAADHVFYELRGSEVGAWDTFSTRNIGLRVNRQMAHEFGGDAERMRDHSTHALERILGVSTSSWAPLQKTVFQNFALVLAQAPDLRAWRREEKEELLQVIRAKTKPDEMLYLHLTQRHDRLRTALLKTGS